MNVPPFVETERLLIQPLTIADDHFMLALVNTEGWLQFIGNRNINSVTDAGAYIHMVLENEHLFYWVVKRKDQQDPIGIITYIKRDYLQHPDIGFAFLPGCSKQGYAYEATQAFLHTLIREHHHTHILAITVPENIHSTRLLQKIGLVFEKEMEVDDKKVHVYGTLTNALQR